MKKNVLLKLNNEKGLTGIDVVVGTSIIIITIVVVTMIALNIDLGGKSINRTAGATRIATTMLEQIEKMYYDEIGEIGIRKSVSVTTEPTGELKRIKDIVDGLVNSEYIVVPGDDNGAGGNTRENKVIIDGKEVTGIQFFNVKIPKGYIVEITVGETHRDERLSVGSSYVVFNGLPRFDLMKDVTINVRYLVGQKENNVSVSTVKKREIIEECNRPDLKALSNDLSKVVPVKYNPVMSNDIKYEATEETDTEWYEYSGGSWAKAILLTGATNINDILADVNKIRDNMYVWIPRYANIGSDVKFLYADTNYAIDKDGKIIGGYLLDSGTKTTDITLNTYKVNTSAEHTPPSEFSSGEKGLWIKATTISSSTSIAYNLDVSEEYGPVKLHLE